MIPTRIISTPTPTNAGHITMGSNQLYAVYLDYYSMPSPVPINYVRGRLHTSNAGAGAQVGEVGLATSSSGPKKAGQTLKVVAVQSNANLDDMTRAGAAMSGNKLASPLSYTPPADTHLWAICRFQMATTNPTFDSTALDFAQGWTLTLAASGVLVLNSTYAAGLIAYDGGGSLNVDLKATFD